MNSKYLKLAITIALFFLGFSSKTFATPISATLEFHAEAILSEFDGITETSHIIDSQTNSWGTLLDPLNISVSANASDPDQFITVSGNASATWGSSGNSGSVIFQNFGFSGDAHNYTADLRNGLDNDIWTYTFIADSDGFFSMTYDVSVVDAIGTFGPLGLRGWDIQWSGAGSGLSLMDSFDPTANGVFLRPVVAGQFYTVGLNGGPSVGSGSSLNEEFSKHIQGNFNFAISPVPEPSMIVLMIVGILTLSVFYRRGM